ncbi:MAG: hypothetical protein KDN20_11180 [Verrucomicrobiae bacterium]|nr:hypothetical protein [Verrucomicrobiae bacterium]
MADILRVRSEVQIKELYATVPKYLTVVIEYRMIEHRPQFLAVYDLEGKRIPLERINTADLMEAVIKESRRPKKP